MNIYDISKMSGVSVTTVSRVLNQSDKVSEKTRLKVMAVMEEAGYTPNAFARGLGLDSMRTVGILCVDPSDPSACTNLAQSVGYLQRELRDIDFESSLYCVGYDMEGKAECLEKMVSRRVDAIIITGSFFIESDPQKNLCITEAAKSVPVFLINGNFVGENIFSILCDDYNATYKATCELILQGAEHIVYIYGEHSESEQRKKDGFLAAMMANNMGEGTAHLFHSLPRGVEEGKAALRELAASGVKFDATITYDDPSAIAVLQYALEADLKVPEQFKVIGHGNSILSRYCYPQLTTTDNNVEQMCLTAISMLDRYMKGANIPKQLTISETLIHRGTTLPKSEVAD